MPDVRRFQRLVRIPVEHLALAAELTQRQGPVEAAKALGIGRTALLGVVATGMGMPGTAALLREAVRDRRGKQA